MVTSPKQTKQWVFNGNIVVPTCNPLSSAAETQEQAVDERGVVTLGPGLLLYTQHVLVVGTDGTIKHFTHRDKMKDFLDYDGPSEHISLHPRREFLVPGFIDLHVHAPQFAYTGTATDRPLMGPDGWLESYTFPAEASLAKDMEKAKLVYNSVVRTTLNAGTTTAVYFATLNVEPCRVLVDTCVALGQRALVGKVCMDRHSPDCYCHTLEQNVEETKQLIDYIAQAGKPNLRVGQLPLVSPIITPRFIPTCSPELLDALGELAASHECHVQSHISESIDEVEYTKSLHNGRTDADIFNSHKLLTERCIMAHGVYLSDTDLDLMKTKGSAVAHCPLSNFYFAGNNCECRKLLKRGNKVGLATDVAGGYSPSMINASRMAVVASHAVHQQRQELKIKEGKDAYAPLDYRHAFYLATLGGAQALGWQDVVGTFRVGMTFDALVLSANDSPLCIFDTDAVEDIFQKLCTLGDDRNVKQVFVNGCEVKRDVTPTVLEHE